MRISDWSSDVCSSDLDGQLVIAVGNDGQFRKLCALLGEPGWADDARFATNAARLANRAELIPLLAARIATWDAQPLSLALEEQGVPAGPINDLAGVFADRQVIARGMRFRPEGAAIDAVASPIVIDRSEEHTSELQSLMRHSYAGF